MQDSIAPSLEQYRKYERTTTVLFALSRLIIDNSDVGRLNGVTKDIVVDGGKITPDVSARCDNDTTATFLELKWSLTESTAKDEILKLRKYCQARFAWSTNPVQRNDVVLVVAQEDADIAVAAIHELIEQENSFLSNVSVWKWFFAHPRTGAGGRSSSDALWISRVYGNTGNNALESLVSSASGYRVPNDVLEFNKYSYRFTKDKPPVQYTVAILLLHVLSSLRTRSDREPLRITTDLTDTVYERAKSFFPGSDSSESIQMRKQWVREALQTMISAGIREVKIPFQTKGPLDEYVCRLLLRKQKKRRSGLGIVRVKRLRPSDFPGQARLDQGR